MTVSNVGDLRINGSVEGASMRLTLEGQADLRDPGPLSGSLLDFHQQAVAHHADKVVVDLKQVEFMNSTALGAFVRWMSELLKLTQDRRYQVVLFGTRERRWQRVSLHALASFAPENISVTFDA